MQVFRPVKRKAPLIGSPTYGVVVGQVGGAAPAGPVVIPNARRWFPGLYRHRKPSR